MNWESGAPFPSSGAPGRTEPHIGTAPRGEQADSATLRWPRSAESPGPPEHHRADKDKPRRFPAAPGTTAPTGGRHGPGLAGNGPLPFPHIGGESRRCIPCGCSLAHGTGPGTGPGPGHGTGLLPAPPPARGAPCRAGHGAAPAQPSRAPPCRCPAGHSPRRETAFSSRGNSATTRKSCVTVIVVSRNLEQ